MRISVTFRNLDSSDALKDYANQKLGKVEKYFDTATDADVVLRKEKHRQIAEVSLSSGPFKVNCTEETDDMYQSIDLVSDKVERQVKRQREKIRSTKTRKSDLEKKDVSSI